jgi:hypothetical protein
MGAAVINTIATTATASYVASHGESPTSLAAGAIHGYTSAFTFSAVVLGAAAVAVFALVRRTRPDRDTGEEVLLDEPELLALAGV